MSSSVLGSHGTSVDCIHVCVCVHMCAYAHALARLCIVNVFVPACMRVCAPVCMCLGVHVCACVLYVHVYVCAQVCTSDLPSSETLEGTLVHAALLLILASYWDQEQPHPLPSPPVPSVQLGSVPSLEAASLPAVAQLCSPSPVMDSLTQF